MSIMHTCLAQTVRQIRGMRSLKRQCWIFLIRLIEFHDVLSKQKLRNFRGVEAQLHPIISLEFFRRLGGRGNEVLEWTSLQRRAFTVQGRCKAQVIPIKTFSQIRFARTVVNEESWQLRLRYT